MRPWCAPSRPPLGEGQGPLFLPLPHAALHRGALPGHRLSVPRPQGWWVCTSQGSLPVLPSWGSSSVLSPTRAPANSLHQSVGFLSLLAPRWHFSRLLGGERRRLSRGCRSVFSKPRDFSHLGGRDPRSWLKRTEHQGLSPRAGRKGAASVSRSVRLDGAEAAGPGQVNYPPVLYGLGDKLGMAFICVKVC